MFICISNTKAILWWCRSVEKWSCFMRRC